MYNNVGSPAFTNVTFSGNDAENGGGVYNQSSDAIFTPDADDKVCRYPGSGVLWECAATTFNATSITRNGVSAFSDWAVGDDVGPTAITLLEFTAEREATGVRLNWATGSELNTAGFRLERGPTSDPASATPLGFIAGEGDLAGASYTHLDTAASSEVRTVKHHVHNILAKLRARHRWQAVAVAQEQGLL
ncbi:MAG: hypothetical protein AB4911_06175 [Oscillochloridaceae bacterium umkhey_bin13]